jgi:hypothetical protein
MSTKSAKTSKTRKSVSSPSSSKPVSYLSNRPYLTIAVLAVLVMALAYTIEIIQNAQMLEARSDYNTRVAQEELLRLQQASPTVTPAK